MTSSVATEKCWQCRGDGAYWRVPDGFNPFLAGAMQTAAHSMKVRCWRCEGTGRLAVHGEKGEGK
jgi:hypothetical protein